VTMAQRNWLCTLNNPEASGETYLKGLYEHTGATYVCGQLEKGSEGTPHLQFFVNFQKTARISKITGYDKRVHCEAVKVNNGADTYCMKTDTRVEGPWEFGERPHKRNSKVDWDLIKAQAQSGDLDSIPGQIFVTHYPKLKQIAKDYMRLPEPTPHLKGIWFVGQSGCGKSKLARERYPDHYPKTCNKWWDGYQGQQAVIMDDFDPKIAQVMGSQKLKVWTDHYPSILETKGGGVAALYKWFIVTSQYSIEECFPDPEDQEALKRRFKVVRFAYSNLYTKVPDLPEEEIVLGKRPLPN